MSKPGISLGRHQRCCTICQHPDCEAIETAFIAWRSPALIAEEYGLCRTARQFTGTLMPWISFRNAVETFVPR